MKGVLLVLFFLPALAFAKPSELTKLKEYAKKNPDAYKGELTCKGCHTKGKELNDYGKAFKDADSNFEKMKK